MEVGAGDGNMLDVVRRGKTKGEGERREEELNIIHAQLEEKERERAVKRTARRYVNNADRITPECAPLFQG